MLKEVQEELPVKPQDDDQSLLTPGFILFAVTITLVTVAWIALLGYGAWLLITWLVG